MVCFRYIIVNTLRRGYNKDDIIIIIIIISDVASSSNVTYYDAIFLHVRTVRTLAHKLN